MSLIHNNNFKWFLVRDNFLSHQECETQIKYIDDNVKSDNFVWGSLHNCKNVITEDKNLLDKVWKFIKMSNTLVYKYDISGIQDSSIKLYPYENFKEDSDRHSDFAAGEGKVVNTCTKLTSVIFLNDDFEGGGLDVRGSIIEAKKGRIVIFPSFAAHKVLQFSKKDRYTLITFAEGNTFK